MGVRLGFVRFGSMAAPLSTAGDRFLGRPALIWKHMKGVAVQLPNDLYEELDELAAETYEGDLNRTVREVLSQGSEYRTLKSASIWRRFRWVLTGNSGGSD